MFCEVVPLDCTNWSLVDKKVFLCYSIFYPEKTHVHSLGLLLPDGRVDDTCGGRVVRFHGSTWLRMVHLGQAYADWLCHLAIVEEGAGFGFCGRSHNVTEYFAFGVKNTIWRGVNGRFSGRAFVAECEVAPQPITGIFD